MKKLLTILFALLFSLQSLVKADEGMWLPLLVERLNYVDMQKMGLNLTPEEIYSINHSSLKDAIVIFGRGCTGELISPEGLLITNHHCGYGSIQSVSTIENDLLSNGFWATQKSEEIPIEGLYVKFLVRIEPVTLNILQNVTDDMTEEERKIKINSNIDRAINKVNTVFENYESVVKSFYNGNEYYMFSYEVYKDVRFVGAPPEAIGKFGADTDNWMWPRHTGDFSMFRIYTAPDGKPAEYSEENIPLKSKHYLPISIAGVEQGDFSMVLGYPGGTDRYMTSYGIDLAVNQSNPTIVKIRDKKLKIMKEGMDADEKVRLQYASKYSRTSNYWKYYIGQTKGLKRLKVSEKKKTLEEEFESWVNENPERKAKYGEALSDIENAYNEIKLYNLSRLYFREAIRRGSEVIGFSRRFSPLLKELKVKDQDKDKIAGIVNSLKESSDKYFKDYNVKIDQNLLAATFKMYYENVPADQLPGFLVNIAKKYKDNFKKFAAYAFKKSIFVSKEKVDAFIENPKAKTIEKDIIYKAMKSFYDNYVYLNNKTKNAYALMAKGNRLFLAGLMEMNPDKKFYPDANFTMRLTYGTVQDYFPADAIHFNYFTTLDGIMEKEDPTTWEFIVPEKLKELYNTKDYGQYSDNDTLKVCFLTNHDITGGNSGSPVINGNGELIGLAFDGNWEAMSGDIAFEPELQRTINVDIRYVLFIIDKFAGATNLIDEMTIVTEKPKLKTDIPEEENIEVEVIEE